MAHYGDDIIDTSYVHEPKPQTFRGRGARRGAPVVQRGTLVPKNEQLPQQMQERWGYSNRGAASGSANNFYRGRGRGVAENSGQNRGGFRGRGRGNGNNYQNAYRNQRQQQTNQQQRYHPYNNPNYRRNQQPFTDQQYDGCEDEEAVFQAESEYLEHQQYRNQQPSAHQQEPQRHQGRQQQQPPHQSNHQRSNQQSGKTKTTPKKKYQSSAPLDSDKACFNVLPQVHLPAAYIQTMKDYRKYRESVEIVADLYGTIDSNVVVKEHSRHEFVLRDRTGRQVISYYPIDENMPYAPAGTHLKAACLWRHWGLQAVKVEVADARFATTLEGKIRLAAMALRQKLEQANLA